MTRFAGPAICFIVPVVLEAGFGYCVGCKIFGLLMRAGLILPEVCAECADISARLGLTVPD